MTGMGLRNDVHVIRRGSADPQGLVLNCCLTNSCPWRHGTEITIGGAGSSWDYADSLKYNSGLDQQRRVSNTRSCPGCKNFAAAIEEPTLHVGRGKEAGSGSPIYTRAALLSMELDGGMQ